ncbi:MAG: Gfo/Idh/MocA family protein [Planctomycetota bacterium]|jgi:predicted dehydrogenase
MKRFKSSSDIKVGVVGYGGAFDMGRTHLAEMQAAGMTPVAVAEVDPKRLKVAAEDFPGIETYPSMGSMLRKSCVNLIVLITPHNTHTKLALQAIRAGRHVVSEKPLAITTAECDRMIAAAKKNKVLLSTYHNRHWDGCILQAVKTIKRSGAIGEIVRIEGHMGGYRKPGPWWRSSKSISGGILYDWGVHVLEYGLQLIDSEMVEVFGFARKGYWAPRTAWKDDTNEDDAHAIVRFASGQWMSLCISSVDSNPKRGQMEITGTKGAYIFDGRTWELIQQRGNKTVVTRGGNPNGQWWRFYKEIADHLVKGAKLTITPEWSRRPIHILDLADRSARTGKAIRTKYK